MPLDGIEAKFLEINACNVHEFSLQQVFDFIVTRQWERLNRTSRSLLDPNLWSRSTDWHCAIGELVREGDHFVFDHGALSKRITERTPLAALLTRLMCNHDDNRMRENAYRFWPKNWRTIATKFGLNDYAVPEG